MRNDWVTAYAEQFSRNNGGRAVTVETERDRYGRHWGRYVLKDAETQIPLATFDYKKAKAAGLTR